MSTQNLFEIKNFHGFLTKSLGKTILEYSLKPLTKPGDNYGSELQAAKVKVANKTDPNEVNKL